MNPDQKYSQNKSHHCKGTAIITGATCGIGEAFARWLATEGYNLLITGRRSERLERLAEELRKDRKVSVTVVTADLSNATHVDQLVHAISELKDISLLINNAGYGSGVEFCGCNLDDNLKMLNVHVMATLKLTHAALPVMIRAGKGAVINVSSLGALAPAPGNAMYSGTKLFLNGFSESLHLEVKRYGIRVLCTCPGFTRTEFHKNRSAGGMREGKGLVNWMSADEVVTRTMVALEKGKVLFIPGFQNQAISLLLKLIPRKWIYYIITRANREKKSREGSWEWNKHTPGALYPISGS